jgi:hypothetical protein
MVKNWNLGDDKYDYTTNSMSSKESAKEESSVWTQLFFGSNKDNNQNTPTISIHDEPSWPPYNVHYDSDGPEYLTSKSSSSEEEGEERQGEDKYQSGRVIDDIDYTEPAWETHVSSRIKHAMKGKRFQSCFPTKEGVVNNDVDDPTNIESQDGGDANGLLQLCMLRNSHHNSKSSDNHHHEIRERQSDDDDDNDDCKTTNKKCNSSKLSAIIEIQEQSAVELNQNNDETGEGAIVEATLSSNQECLIKYKTVTNIGFTGKAALFDHECPLQDRDAEVLDQPAVEDVEQQSNYTTMISKIGLMSISENKVNDSAADSNHTRTTADSTILDSSHSRVSAASKPNLDPVFTLNNSVEASHGPSKIKDEDQNDDASSNNKDDDDSSAWFGFHENCNAAPAILAPVKTGSTVNYSTQDYDNDTDGDDEGIDTLTTTLASLDTHSFLESDELTNLSASTSFNLYYDTNTNTDIADELGRLGEDLLYIFSPHCLLPEEEIVFNDEDEADIEEQTRQQNQGIGSFFNFIGMGTESPDCCGCNESGEDMTLSNASIIDDCEEEDMKTKRPKSKKSSLLKDCIEKEEDNTSDEEDPIAILVDNPTNDDDRAKKKEHTDFDIEIKLEDYENTAAEKTIVKPSAEVYQEIYYNFESLTETLDLELHVIHESSFGSNITDTKDRYSSFHESSTRDDTWMIASHSSDSMGIPPPPEDQSIPSQMEYLREDGTISFDSLLSDDLSIPVPSEPLKQQGKNPSIETSFALNEATQQYNELSNHRRRHTIDHIPTFYSKITKGSIQPLSPAFGGCNNSDQPLVNFDKRTKLPLFLADQKKITSTVQSSVVEITENEENQSPAKSLHLQQSLPNGLKSVMESMKNKSKHSQNEIPLDDKNYNGSNSFQSNLWNTIQDNERECYQPTDGELGPKSDEQTGEETPEEEEEEEENLFQPFLKGILRKTGSLSSGRRIRWDEEQLAAKKEKGVMHSSGRQSRSICPLDQLILHVTEIQDLYDAEETLLATTSRRRSIRSQRDSLRAVMSHQGYLC